MSKIVHVTVCVSRDNDVKPRKRLKYSSCPDHITPWVRYRWSAASWGSVKALQVVHVHACSYVVSLAVMCVHLCCFQTHVEKPRFKSGPSSIACALLMCECVPNVSVTIGPHSSRTCLIFGTFFIGISKPKKKFSPLIFVDWCKFGISCG